MVIFARDWSTNALWVIATPLGCPVVPKANTKLNIIDGGKATPGYP